MVKETPCEFLILKPGKLYQVEQQKNNLDTSFNMTKSKETPEVPLVQDFINTEG